VENLLAVLNLKMSENNIRSVLKEYSKELEDENLLSSDT